MTEAQLRRQVCDTARGYLGSRESDGSHRPIIDAYNAIRPLPGGYALGYDDPWCAAFVSAVGARCGLERILFPHCNCEAMIGLYRAAGRWEEQDFAVPKPGDLIFYDWQDDGVGDCRGTADHVGLVLSVTGNLLQVIEGNKSDAVGLRSIPTDARCIRGYGQPDYASLADEPRPVTDASAPSASTPSVIAKPVTDVTGCGNPSPSSSPATAAASASSSSIIAENEPDPSASTPSVIAKPVTDATGCGNPSPSSSPATAAASASSSSIIAENEPAPATSTPSVIAKPVTDVTGCGNPSSPSSPSSPASPSTSPSPSAVYLPTLRRGDKGETVRAMQLLLIGRGYRCGPAGADGDFGPGTSGGLLRFQRGRQLSADGLCGPETWRALLGIL